MIATGIVIANTAPTPQIVACAMREGTTLMDITYRVNDPDDAVVSAWPLAFVDGTRSFAKVIRPATFVEGTENNFGTNVLANTSYQLVWDVGADWNIDLGQIKFEIICKDSGGLLPFAWISIPATVETEALTISKNTPTAIQTLDALFWLYALKDDDLALASGILSGNSESGVFNSVTLVSGSSLEIYATPFVLKKMNLDFAGSHDYSLTVTARAGLSNPNVCYAVSRPFAGLVKVCGWGNDGWNSTKFIPSNPSDLVDVIAIAAGNMHGLALKSDGTVVNWGESVDNGNVPAGLKGVTAIAASDKNSIALKSDGTVVCWGSNIYGQNNPPIGLSSVKAIAAGFNFNLALKQNGTVVGWGRNDKGATTIPVGLTNVIAIAAGSYHSLALKSDGTVVGWGGNDYGVINIPSGLTNVTAIVSNSHNLALKSDGTVVGWGGRNMSGETNIPTDLKNVISIAAGSSHSLALKGDGTVVGWGGNFYGQISIPVGLTNVVAIAARYGHSLALQAKTK